MARLIVLALLLVPGVALADPITLVASLAPIIGSTAAGFLVSYGGYIAAGALALVGQASARRKQRAAIAAQKAQYNASLQERNITVLNNEAPQKIIYGNPSPVGGAVVAIFTSGEKDQYKHLVVVFAAHECEAIDEVYIEGEPVGTLDGNGWVTAGKFYENAEDITTTELVTFNGSGIGTVSRVVGSLLCISFTDGNGDTSSYYTEYPGTASGTTITSVAAANLTVYVSYTYASGDARVNLQKHLSPGGVDTADAFLISRVPTKWTTAHKLTGYTYCVITLDLNFGRFQGGPPNITAKIRGKKIYDYRTATTAYSNNPALCVADYLTSTAGFSATVGQIDSTAVIAAANACDTQVFTTDGVISTDNARDANLQMLEDAMAGTTHFSGGVWRIIAGAWASPVMTLTDSTTLAGAIEVVQASNPREGRFNGARGQYVPSNGLGVSTDFTPYTVASYLSADGASLVKDIQLPMTATNAQCQKLAAIEVERSRLGLTINYPAQLSCWKLQPGDRVNVSNTELGFVSKTFRVVDWAFAANAPQSLVLTEDASSAYTGTFSEADPTLATSNLVDPWARPAAPSNFVINSGTGVLQKGSDGTIITRVRCTWQASTVRSVLQGGYTQLQWRLATATDDKWQSIDLPADAISTFLTGIVDRSALLIRVRFITGLLVQGSWATQAHTVLGKSDAPTAPTYVTASTSSVFWGVVSDFDLAGYRVRAYPGSSGAVWSRATVLHTDLLTSAPWTFTTQLYGVQTIMVVSEDTSGNQSTAATCVVDFGAASTSNSVQSIGYQALLYPGTQTNCSVSGGNLLATSGSDIYALSDEYGEADVYATTYSAMTYVSQPFYTAYNGGTLTLNAALTGANATIEYQIDGDTQIDLYAAADDYASSNLYGTSSNFANWPGGLPMNRAQGVIFRVSIGAGATQGQIAAFTASLIMLDVRQQFGNVAVPYNGERQAPSAGTPARNWISVKTVQITPVVDGGAAIAGRVLDFSPTLGPLIQLIDNTGTPVAGRATIDIGGLADV